MTSFVFPTAVTIWVFGIWVVLGVFETCVLKWTEPPFHCEQSPLFYSVFAGVVAVIAGFMALVAHVIYHPVLPFPTKTSELPSALLASSVIALVSYGLMRWEFYFPTTAEPFFDWLGVSLLACGIALIVVNYCSRGKREL